MDLLNGYLDGILIKVDKTNDQAAGSQLIKRLKKLRSLVV